MDKTIHDQRYISDELCHFVGRGKNEDDQYDIFVNKILKKGWITHGPHHKPTMPRSAGLDLSKPISRDEAIRYQVVCFCDIPIQDLRIHVNKYSKFGISFKKSSLLRRVLALYFIYQMKAPFQLNNYLPQMILLKELKMQKQMDLLIALCILIHRLEL